MIPVNAPPPDRPTMSRAAVVRMLATAMTATDPTVIAVNLTAPGVAAV